MLRIVIDGAGDMPAAWADQYQIDVIPINIHFGEELYLQGVDLSDEDFYRIARETGTIPKTSQPSPHQFVEFYKRIAEPEDTILSIHVTGKLSGTYESAEAAARDLAGSYKVIPFDSGCGSAAMGYMAREVRQMDRSGADLQAILERLEFIRSNVSILLTLDNLEFARRSGRVKALQAALASLLNVKPIVALKDGVLDMSDRVRTRRRALDYLLDTTRERFGERRINVAVVHAADPESGRTLMGRVPQELNAGDLIMTDLSISVAANLGPGTVGIVAYPVESE